MARKMALPKIGVNMTEAFISKWLIKQGDRVCVGDAVLEAETEKSSQEIYATEAGIVAELLCLEGDTVQCHEDIIIFIDEGEDYVKAPQVLEPVAAPAASAESKPEPETAPRETPFTGGLRIRISPLAKKMAAEHKIDVSLLAPSEPGGRIVKADVLRFLASPPETASDGVLEAIPLSAMRKTIAARLSESNLQKPCAALTTTVNASALLALRELHARRGVKLSVDAILAKTAGHVLKSHRIINSVLEGDVILIKREINVGVAVDTPKGLMVPVLRGAGSAPLVKLAEDLSKLAEDARESRLSARDMSGGTFTITNLGMFGIEQFTPVINPPECCILAIGSIKNECVAGENGTPAFQKRFQMTLVFDHRIVDGAPAARFLKDLKEHLENPELMI